MSDFYRTLQGASQGLYKEKMSKFISFAQPAASEDEARAVIKAIGNKYHDARHCCWAFMVGTQQRYNLSSDNGEPSGTAGKPILGQINSFELTNVVIVLVRYFGGIKLGTSGLIAAYREAARQAILAGTILELHEQAQFTFSFPYLAMNDVMRIVKQSAVKVLNQQFDNNCLMTLQCDLDAMPALRARMLKVPGTKAIE